MIVFLSPPWGVALDDGTGLDLRRTTPPVSEIVDLAMGVFDQNKLLFAIQAYELVEAHSLAELTRRFGWSSFNVYDINPHAKNPGLILGTVGWTPDRREPRLPRRGSRAALRDAARAGY